MLDKLKYGNEGARQRGRFNLPAMSSGYIDDCCREVARVLIPSGYLLRWTDTFHLCEGDHLRIAELKTVDLIAWDSLRPGNGYRSRRRGDYLLVLQKPPLAAKSTWRDHGICNRWPEKINRKIHPHIKPIDLIRRLIGAFTSARKKSWSRRPSSRTRPLAKKSSTGRACICAATAEPSMVPAASIDFR